MKKSYIIFLGALLLMLGSYAFCHKINQSSQQTSSVVFPPDSLNPLDLEIPFLKSDAPVVRHAGYAFQYAENHEQAYWVAYELTKKETEKAYSRTDNFIPDPFVKTGTAGQADYSGSGFDRGHLAPAADMGWSKQAMEESFYFSNMSPQAPSFNRGIWKRLEEQVRSWAIVYDSVYVVTGPVLQEGLPTIGANKVSVPKYYYKVILDNTGKDKKAIGFLMANEASKGELTAFAVPVDRIEKETGIDFFNKLPDNFESKVEKELCLTCWSWSITKPQNATEEEEEKDDDNSKGAGVKNQCKGVTKAGTRCKRSCSEGSSYCYQHQP